MARTSTSLDLSEFFNDDDSEGHRLVEFLQNRRGGIKRKDFLFVNYEPQRLNLNVQLEKLPTFPQKNNLIAIAKNEGEISVIENNIQKEAPSEALAANTSKRHQLEHHTNDCPPALPILPQSPKNVYVTSSVLRQNSATTTNLNQPIASSRPLSPHQLSPSLSSVGRSVGAVSPSDRLRRYSLRRLSRQFGGRRTLLQQFESTLGDTNFEPAVCSTPLSQPLQDKPHLPLNSVQSPEAENVGTNISHTTPVLNESHCNCTDTLIRTLQQNVEVSKSKEAPVTNESRCNCTDTLIKTLQRNDEELRNYMESVIDNNIKNIQGSSMCNKSITNKTNTTLHGTKSPLKRTYTVEKGNIRGQVILTPDNSAIQNNTRLSKLSTSDNHSLRNISLRSSNSVRDSKIKKNVSHKSQQDKLLNDKAEELEVPNTPPQSNVSIVFQTQEVEIAETQKSPDTRQNPITIQSNSKFPTVIIPVNQTFNKTCGKENLNNSTSIIKKGNIQPQTRSNSYKLPADPIQQHVPLIQETGVPIQLSVNMNEDACFRNAENNLKLSDILTDDEDSPKSQSIDNNNSLAPLNLAPSATNLRTKRLRKRSSQRRLQMENCQPPNTEPENETSAQLYSTRHTLKRKKVPLNRAPGIPLNGEQFAKELARMSNYEILDLRKRNSMGKVFAICGRKSVLSKEDAVKEQIRLENQIEREILKRKLGENFEKEDKRYSQNILDGDQLEERFPVPDEFRDSLQIQEDGGNLMMDSLIDEQISDIVSFKNNYSEKSRPKRRNKKEMPEVLKQYLEMSKRVTRKKRKISPQSKRSLFAQEEYESQKIDEVSEVKESSNLSIRKLSISYVPSPPKANSNFNTTVKVVSPPPPLTLTPRKSLTEKRQQITSCDVEENLPNSIANMDNLTVQPPPPPPGFESDSSMSSNHDNYTSFTRLHKTVERNTIINNINNNSSTNSDEHLFKKPDRPAPKKKIRKQKDMSNSKDFQESRDSNQTVNSSSDSTEGAVRRSKRAHVCVNQKAEFFQTLYKQTVDRLQIFRKRKNSTRNRTSNSIDSERGGKKKQLSPVPENNSYVDDILQDVEPTIKNKKAKTSRSKNVRKKNENDKENHECSQIVPKDPPQVDQLNNVFNHLMNTSSTRNTSLEAVQVPLRVKPFAIRVPRLKSSASQFDLGDATCSTSSFNKSSNHELISWLKSMTECDISTTQNEKIFKEMRISSASSMAFTELQGVEYAFYDTDEKASLGYLRFKPHQIKPKKRAKRFHLHFVALVGNFRITANDKESKIGVGDMVAIKKSVYYDIENITDDVGILMVVKK